jgi:hypothetical protein
LTIHHFNIDSPAFGRVIARGVWCWDNGPDKPDKSRTSPRCPPGYSERTKRTSLYRDVRLSGTPSLSGDTVGNPGNPRLSAPPRATYRALARCKDQKSKCTMHHLLDVVGYATDLPRLSRLSLRLDQTSYLRQRPWHPYIGPRVPCRVLPERAYLGMGPNIRCPA